MHFILSKLHFASKNEQTQHIPPSDERRKLCPTILKTAICIWQETTSRTIRVSLRNRPFRNFTNSFIWAVKRRICRCWPSGSSDSSEERERVLQEAWDETSAEYFCGPFSNAEINHCRKNNVCHGKLYFCSCFSTTSQNMKRDGLQQTEINDQHAIPEINLFGLRDSWIWFELKTKYKNKQINKQNLC